MKVSPEIWEGFLNLKLKCQKIKRLDDLTSFDFTPEIKLQFQIENKDCFVKVIEGNNTSLSAKKKLGPGLNISFSDSIGAQVKNSFLVYLPIILGSLLDNNKCFVFAHFAQSIDGKIATTNGKSKWIGNQENQKHAHRLRALADAILIGSKTLKNDQPKLNVRLVKGLDPIRVIIANNEENFDSLKEASENKILVITDETKNSNSTDQLELLKLKRHNGYYDTSEIISKLFIKGIKSIFIEGGALTLQIFLRENNIDFLQSHIAPMIIGNGKCPYDLTNQEIVSIDQAQKLSCPILTPVGDSIMYSGYLK